MPDNHAPYIADDTMRHYDELSRLGQRYHDGDKAVGAVTQYGNQAWGAGNNSAHGDYAHSMGLGGVSGGIAGLLHEALRNKTEQEKNQTMGRKLMRYAGKGGLGALAGAGAGSLYQAAMHKVSASEWKAVDLAKNPINWSRTLPKADASAKNWQGVGGQKPAAPPMVPVNQAPPMVPVGAKTAADDNNDNKPNERKQRAKNRAEDLVPMKGFGRGYADYVLPSTFGGTRAGRAAMIAKALGQKPDFSVAHPNTDAALSSLSGSVVGGVGGAGIGALLGALGGNPEAGAILGGGIGGMGGSLLGIAGSGMERREQMQKIQDDLASELEQHGTSRLNLKTPQYGVASSLLMPLGGAHRAGQADAYEALKNNTRYAKTPGRTAGYLAAHVPYVGPLLNMGQGMAQNFSARKRMKQEQPEIADNYGLEEFGAAKAASLRSFGAKVAAFDLSALTKHIPEGLQKVMPAAGAGALGGAALGGLHGLIAPGHEDIYDDEGNVVGRQQRSRFGAALRGALGGGAAGGLAAGALEHFRPGTFGQAQSGLNNLRQMYNRNTPMPTKSVQVARDAMTNAGEEPMYDEQLGANAAMQAAQRG